MSLALWGPSRNEEWYKCRFLMKNNTAMRPPKQRSGHGSSQSWTGAKPASMINYRQMTFEETVQVKKTVENGANKKNTGAELRQTIYCATGDSKVRWIVAIMSFLNPPAFNTAPAARVQREYPTIMRRERKNARCVRCNEIQPRCTECIRWKAENL